MPIPKYDEIMLAVLRNLGDGAEHSRAELADKMTEHLDSDYFEER
jgi:restriction endonuclease Mrr